MPKLPPRNIVPAEAVHFGMLVELMKGMTIQPMEPPMSLRDTAKGVAIRAGILSVVTIFGSVWISSLLLKFAGTAMRAMLGVLMLLIAGGLVTFEVKKVQKRLTT
ncbi:MAG TPA: hypothetical protein VH087_10295 [Thermoanaerobaculia bacterium]|jgi:hypothetical protein|nr:hypothetical protein [Thermoanaerobaculia bacterium]